MNTFRLLCATFAILLFSIPCSGASPKLAPDLAGLDPASFVDVIVQYTAAPNESHAARIRALGGTPKVDLSVIHAAVYTLPAAALEALANTPNVVYVSPDREVRATLDYANPTVGAQYTVKNGWDGTGVGVAIIDSGITGETDLLDKSTNASNVSRILYSQSFVSGVTSTADQYGHGTHVAGVVAGGGTAAQCRHRVQKFFRVGAHGEAIPPRRGVTR